MAAEAGIVVSVVIPAYNEAANVARCVGAAWRAAETLGLAYEILVMDDASTDGTADAARTAGATRVVTVPKRITVARLRNIGAREARGGLLAFLDADMEPPPDWLSRAVGVVRGGTADVIGYVVGTPPDAPWYARRWAEQVVARRGRRAEVDYLPGCNLVVPRERFLAVGGFDEDLTTAEDKDLTLRLAHAGARVVSDPALVRVFHHWGYERSLRELLRKEFWRQGNHLAMLRRHGVTRRMAAFPLVALAHALWPLLPTAAAVSGQWPLAAALTAAWPIPALLLCLRFPVTRSRPKALLQFTFLHWTRMIVAGWAVLTEAPRAVLR